MRLDGRRTSNNVDDRRGISGRAAGIGGGLVGIIAVVAITLLSGGNIGDVISNLMGSGQLQSGGQEQYVETAEDAQLAKFASQVLAGTEDAWTQIFREQGWGEYRPPKLVLFHGSVQSGCGGATAQTGPFYCSADQSVYIDLDFFKDMEQTIGGGGDFAYAYVIAHEVGHHVQYLLGTLDNAHERMQRLSESEANKISVRLELQADFYAGVWGHHDNSRFKSLEPGDLDEALDAARKIGDDYLQKRARGYAVPESFNHGTSEQRRRWLNLGLSTGNPALGDTFTPSYSDL